MALHLSWVHGQALGPPMSSFWLFQYTAEESRPVSKAKKAEIKETNLLSPSLHELFLSYSSQEVKLIFTFILTQTLTKRGPGFEDSRVEFSFKLHVSKFQVRSP